MKEKINNVNVIVNDGNEPIVTIVKERKPTHNPSRSAVLPSIVVRYFSDDDLQRLHEIKTTPIELGKVSRISGAWQKCVEFVINKNKKD